MTLTVIVTVITHVPAIASYLPGVSGPSCVSNASDTAMNVQMCVDIYYLKQSVMKLHSRHADKGHVMWNVPLAQALLLQQYGNGRNAEWSVLTAVLGRVVLARGTPV